MNPASGSTVQPRARVPGFPEWSEVSRLPVWGIVQYAACCVRHVLHVIARGRDTSGGCWFAARALAGVEAVVSRLGAGVDVVATRADYDVVMEEAYDADLGGDSALSRVGYAVADLLVAVLRAEAVTRMTHESPVLRCEADASGERTQLRWLPRSDLSLAECEVRVKALENLGSAQGGRASVLTHAGDAVNKALSALGADRRDAVVRSFPHDLKDWLTTTAVQPGGRGRAASAAMSQGDNAETQPGGEKHLNHKGDDYYFDTGIVDNTIPEKAEQLPADEKRGISKPEPKAAALLVAEADAFRQCLKQLLRERPPTGTVADLKQAEADLSPIRDAIREYLEGLIQGLRVDPRPPLEEGKATAFVVNDVAVGFGFRPRLSGADRPATLDYQPVGTAKPGAYVAQSTIDSQPRKTYLHGAEDRSQALFAQIELAIAHPVKHRQGSKPRPKKSRG